MSEPELRELLAVALRAAEVARGVVMPLFRSETAIELKSDRSPVTAADRGAEEAMRAFLGRECPGHGVLGEEFGETAGDGRHRWVLDPIDGTKAFIHGVPLFGTLVALERDGSPVVGVIACHAAGETAYAALGGGAFLNGEPIQVSRTEAVSEAAISMSSFRRMPRYQGPAFLGLCERAGMLRTWGDCYGYLLVAAGRIDAMIDPVMNRWDVAALYPVVTEAGGIVSQWTGELAPGESAVASNGLIHAELIGLLNDPG